MVHPSSSLPFPRFLRGALAASLWALALDAQAPIQPPPFMDGLFPCTSCHDGKKVVTNTRKRALEDMHENIVLNHLGKDRWCFDCHDPKERDRLHLAKGGSIDFANSHLICGQCHGGKLQEWKAGRHGRKSEGQSELLLCVACHNPHAPR